MWLAIKNNLHRDLKKLITSIEQRKEIMQTYYTTISNNR
jgi:hypothetical protein